MTALAYFMHIAAGTMALVSGIAEKIALLVSLVLRAPFACCRANSR